MIKRDIILPFLILVILLLPKTVSASALYFLPESINKTVNNQVELELRLNSEGELVNALGIVLDYNSSVLNLSKIDYQSSAFSMQAKEKLTPGKIKITRANVTPQNGDLLVAKLTFRTIKDGQAKVSINPESAIPTGTENKNSLSLVKSRGAAVEVVDPNAKKAGGSSPANISSIQVLLVAGMVSGVLMSAAGGFILLKRKHAPKTGSETTRTS